MNYTIAKTPLKNVKTNTRRSYDSSCYYYIHGAVDTGCSKLDDFIRCMHNVVSNDTNYVRISYDAPTDVLNVSVERSCEIQYKMEFKLVISDDSISYNIKVPKIDWTKVVKDAKPFNNDITASDDTLTVIDTNHAELKLIANAIKKHYAKYNLCKHYFESMVMPASAIDQKILDNDLIDIIDKHAKEVTLKRINALCKKYSIIATPEVNRVTYFYHNDRKTLEISKLSDGTFEASVEVSTSYKLDKDCSRDLPNFYLTYYINAQTGKITWLFCDDKIRDYWYASVVHCKDEKICAKIEIDQIGDWKFDVVAKSYDEWFAKLGFSEYVNGEVGKLLARIKAKRGL